MKKTILVIGIILVVVLGISIILFVKFPKDTELKTSEPESYISCGCGCCTFDKPLEEIAKVECLYKSKNESIQDKIDSDKKLSSKLCANVGCSFPTKYEYCD